MKKLFSISAALLLAGASLFAQDRSKVLKIYNWSDYIDEEILKEFPVWYKEQTGEDIEIVYQLFDINEVMLAKIEKGKADFDVVCPSDYMIERMLNHGLLLPINKDFGDTPSYLDNVSPFFRDAFKNKLKAPAGVDVNDYAVGYMWGTTGFLYNTKYVKPEEVSTWGAILNPRFENKIFMKDAPRDVYSPLLIYIHPEVTNLDSLMFSTSDEDIAAVEKILVDAKPNIAGWEADFGKEMMTQEKAWLNWTWSGDAAWAMQEAADVNVELDYIVPEEGSTYWFDGWVIPKYAQNIKAASYFINYMCQSEMAIRNMDATGYVSVIGTPEVLESVQESAIENGFTQTYDVSYLFGEDGKEVIVDPVYYPSQEIMDRCALEHDADEDTIKLLKMWQRVKGDNLSTPIIIIIVLVVLAIVFFAVKSVGKKGKNAKKTKK
ncbi:MAG: ABC transporter substrate-binding protein [Bacteroidales bacterium]|nr:ABC transporter substrate-binding protein [Bacteroidales bacterium]